MTSEYTVEQLKDMLFEAQLEEKERIADRRYRHIKRRQEQFDKAVEDYGKPEIVDKRVTITEFNNKYHPPKKFFPEFHEKRLEEMGFVKQNKGWLFFRMIWPNLLMVALVCYLALLDI